MPEKSTNGGAKTFDVVVTRVLDAPIEEVWKAWKDPAYVMRWWGPTGFTSPSAEMDFRIGGSCWCACAPLQNTVARTCTTRGPTPGSCRTRGSSSFRTSPPRTGRTSTQPRWAYLPGVPHDVPHVVTLEPAGEERTEVTVTEHGYRTEQARDLSRAGMEQCLDKMAAIFAG